jgi:protein-disulfide isomerase
MIKNSKLLKIATAFTLLTTSAFALTDTEKFILKFEKNRISKNKDVKLLELELRQALPIDKVNGWKAYLFDIKVKLGEKELKTTDMLLSNGTVIANNLFDIKTKRAIKDDIHPKIKDSYYNKEHLIAGTHGSKNKIVVFSDPHCPFCIELVPEVTNFVKKNSKNIALYYYHYPLPFHPLAETIVKATIVAKHKGIKDSVYKSYTSKLTRKNISKEEALKEFNKKLKTNISMKDLEKDYVIKEFKKDMKVANDMLIQGTPTLFVNGVKDVTRSEYLKLGK